jgi:hypothetical protein
MKWTDEQKKEFLDVAIEVGTIALIALLIVATLTVLTK